MNFSLKMSKKKNNKKNLRQKLKSNLKGPLKLMKENGGNFTKPLNYLCPICNKTFTSAAALEKHQKFHVEPSQCFSCSECAEIFEKRWLFCARALWCLLSLGRVSKWITDRLLGVRSTEVLHLHDVTL